MTVELPILGLLKDRPMHGYELRQALGKVAGHFWRVSWGSLYPMLKKLEERGYLDKAIEPQDRAPERIVYCITPAGEQRLLELLTASDSSAEPTRGDDFLMKVAFFHLLTPVQRLALIEAHTAKLHQTLDGLLAEEARVGQRTNRYRRALLDYALARIRTDIEWAAALRQQEQQMSQ